MDKHGVIMILEPKNNWIEVDLSFDKKEEKESLIALPEDYRPAEKPYKAVLINSSILLREATSWLLWSQNE